MWALAKHRVAGAYSRFLRRDVVAQTCVIFARFALALPVRKLTRCIERYFWVDTGNLAGLH